MYSYDSEESKSISWEIPAHGRRKMPSYCDYWSSSHAFRDTYISAAISKQKVYMATFKSSFERQQSITQFQQTL